MIERLIFWMRSFLKIKSVKQAQEMNPNWLMNIHGDQINTLGCRSLWYDKYLNDYRCDECLNINQPRIKSK